MRATKSGEIHVSVPWGVPRATVERFVEEHRDWIAKALERTAQRERKDAAFYSRMPLRTRRERQEADSRLGELIAPMMEKYAALTSKRPLSVKFNSARTRWGSCNKRTREIRFSRYLLLLPEFCVEHVVAHEMAHLLVANHGPRFYAVMDRIFPLWKEARKATRVAVDGGQSIG